MCVWIGKPFPNSLKQILTYPCNGPSVLFNLLQILHICCVHPVARTNQRQSLAKSKDRLQFSIYYINMKGEWTFGGPMKRFVWGNKLS